MCFCIYGFSLKKIENFVDFNFFPKNFDFQKCSDFAQIRYTYSPRDLSRHLSFYMHVGPFCSEKKAHQIRVFQNVRPFSTKKNRIWKL